MAIAWPSSGAKTRLFLADCFKLDVIPPSLRSPEYSASPKSFPREGNAIGEECKITYAGLLDRVQRFANVLKSLGVKKGDTVAIYQPMVLDLVVAMLACARIGAPHSIVVQGC
jgi:non-ribosomal peptide synthetase component E (peptide arylation enzyme)